MFNILIVEDDRNSRKLMEVILRTNGYEYLSATNGIEALSMMENHHVDLIILDVMMPKMNGYQLASELRKNHVETPILMVTAKQLLEDKKKGFLAGTDDYMVKPVDEEEMMLRIKALLRRARIVHEHQLIIKDTILDYDSLTVFTCDDKQTLPQKEFYLLYLLLSYPNKIFTRLQLMDEIWGMDSETNDNTVNVHINRLRKRFEDNKDFSIITIRGLGYKGVRNA
ncbi:MAG: response regulator transcription factor [Erysipelotrichaceae bacterium]|nr:response regulator transcription factor [Erysipelotrichaceae bacterium]MDD4642465.1 response regulator transcription factor [Erysipelotrichaceae bacterium]